MFINSHPHEINESIKLQDLKYGIIMFVKFICKPPEIVKKIGKGKKEFLCENI